MIRGPFQKDYVEYRLKEEKDGEAVANGPWLKLVSAS